MIEDLAQASKADERLASLLDEAREYAQIYRLAVQRHKGCEGTGELVTLREEFRDMLEKLRHYCREKGYPCDITSDDADAAVRELAQDTTGR